MKVPRLKKIQVNGRDHKVLSSKSEVRNSSYAPLISCGKKPSENEMLCEFLSSSLVICNAPLWLL